MTTERKGKNFSRNNVSGKRKASDSYATPYELTRRFVNRWGIDKSATILEPCAGPERAIEWVLYKAGYRNITAFDILDDPPVDFFKYGGTADYIITNPPYSRAFEFIERAKKIATKGFAMLLPVSYLHGKKRYDKLWTDSEYPLKELYVFTRYPMLGEPLRDDGKFNTGMVVYTWYVWEKGYTGGRPEIDWIDINDCIVRRGKHG